MVGALAGLAGVEFGVRFPGLLLELELFSAAIQTSFSAGAGAPDEPVIEMV